MFRVARGRRERRGRRGRAGGDHPVSNGYEAVIGLEVHVELATATNSSAGLRNEFGAEPNTNVCPVCLGLPGSLPVLNEAVVGCALRFGAALGFDVPPVSVFARKKLLLPRHAEGLPISQYELPICVDGHLDVDGTRIGIERAHLEEDTGKTQHAGETGRIHGADHSLVDYNRAGVPLMEIVSRPDIRSAEQARAYVSELRGVLAALAVSDVKMEEGSMRVDANVSVRRSGRRSSAPRSSQEMNSLRSLGRAVRARDRPPDRGGRVGRPGGAGEPPLGTKRPGSRTRWPPGGFRRLPVLPRTRPRPTWRPTTRCGPGRRGGARAPRPRRARLVRDWGDRRPRRPRARRRPGAGGIRRGGRRRRGAGPRGRQLVHRRDPRLLNETGLSAEVLPAGARTAWPSWWPSSARARLSRKQAKDVLAECLREPKRPPPVVEERRSRPGQRRGRSWPRWWSASLAEHPDDVEGLPRRRRQGPPRRSGASSWAS